MKLNRKVSSFSALRVSKKAGVAAQLHPADSKTVARIIRSNPVTQERLEVASVISCYRSSASGQFLDKYRVKK